MHHIDQLLTTECIVEPATGQIQTRDNAIKDVQGIAISQVRERCPRETDVDGGNLFLGLLDLEVPLRRERLHRHFRKSHRTGWERAKKFFYAGYCLSWIDVTNNGQHHIAWHHIALIKGDHILTL